MNKIISFGGGIYSRVTILNNIFYTWYLFGGLGYSYIFLPHTQKKVTMGDDMLISLIMVIISQCIHMSKHHFVHLKYI